MSLRIQLHGPFEARLEGSAARFPAQSAAEVLAFTLLQHGRTADRLAVTEAVWPTASQAHSLTSLRTALHRVRRTAGPEILKREGDRIIAQSDVETDIDEARALRRRFHLAPNHDAALACLLGEWEIRRKPLLEGWRSDWVGPLRSAGEIGACECGRELALLAESAGKSDLAADVWRGVRALAPHDIQAIKRLVRLEAELRGQASALILTKEIEDEISMEADPLVVRALKNLRESAANLEPLPVLVTARSEVLLLARMFESNLSSNREEALRLLLAESRKEAKSHPRVAFSLMNLGLRETSGPSQVRIDLALIAVSAGVLVSEYEAAHHWADFVLESTSPESTEHVEALSQKGYIYIMQRDLSKANEFLRRAVSLSDRYAMGRERMAARVSLASAYVHSKEWGEAERLNRAAEEIAHEIGADIPQTVGLIRFNLAMSSAFQCRWEDCLDHAEAARRLATELPFIQWLGSMPMGLALANLGRAEEAAGRTIESLSQTSRERMTRINQMALDFAALHLRVIGREEESDAILSANTAYRGSVGHPRSPAEAALVQQVVGGEARPTAQRSGLCQQDPQITNAWVCDLLRAG